MNHKDWDFVNRRLVAKMLSEMEYEQVFHAESQDQLSITKQVDLKDPPAGVRKLISEIRVDSLVSAMKSAKTNMDNICL